MDTKQAIKQYELALQDLKRSRARLRRELKGIVKRRGRKLELKERPGRSMDFFFKWAYISLHKPAVDKYMKAVNQYLKHIPDGRAASGVFQQYIEETATTMYIGLIGRTDKVEAASKRLVTDLCATRLKKWKHNKSEDNLISMIVALQEAQIVGATGSAGYNGGLNEVDTLLTEKKIKGAYEL